MNWNTWADFFHMGGYGLYVWGTFIITVLVLSGELIELHHRRKQASEGLELARQDQHETT